MDALIPTEVARRVAPLVDAAVAPTVNYSLSYPGLTKVTRTR